MKKFLFFLPIFLFIILPKDTFAKAPLTLDGYSYQATVTNNGTAYGSVDLNWSNRGFANQQDGKLLFNFTYSSSSITSASMPGLVSVRAKGQGGALYNCYYTSFTSNLSSNDNETNSNPDYSSVTVSAVCPIDLWSDGLSGLQVSFRSPAYPWSINFQLAGTVTFIPNEDNQDVVDAIEEGNQSQNETNDKLDDLNDNITNSDSSGATDSAGSFFEDFKDNDYGLSDIVTMPLEFIKGLSGTSCYLLELPLPFVDKDVEIPCMTSIYETYFGSFLTLYQIITTGFISYWVCVNIYGLVKGFKDPDTDKVEVMDL